MFIGFVDLYKYYIWRLGVNFSILFIFIRSFFLMFVDLFLLWFVFGICYFVVCFICVFFVLD